MILLKHEHNDFKKQTTTKIKIVNPTSIGTMYCLAVSL